MSQSVSTYVWAQDVQSLTVSLVKKRAAVEELTDQVEREKRLRREQQRAFSAQKAQLESELQREDVRHAQLVEAKGRKTAVIDSAKQSDVALLPVFEKGAESLKAYINTSLPFRRSERLGEVKNLQDRLKNGLLTPRNALNRLWSLVEDERRMSKENGLFRNTLVIDGQSMMVDVIRIGTVGMYFRTGTGRVGVVTKAGKVWQSQFLDSESSRRQVSTLFDAFKKQIRVGFFDLPNLITSGEDS
jgi:hypothetical protein